MISYKLIFENPHLHFLNIEMEIDLTHHNAEFIELQLPSWRPGRYELGNFAKNIVSFSVFNESNLPIPFKKTTKDLWLVKTNYNKKINVKYTYYAADLNAGSTLLNEEQLYVNPVNCLLYLKNNLDLPHQLQLIIPENFTVAGSLRNHSTLKNTFIFSNYHQLADSPFIASNLLTNYQFNVADTSFHLWFMGICNPDFIKIEKDFTAFIEVQKNIFKEFPFKKYYFLFQILPKGFYHGVEHIDSTVIALGPGYNLMQNGGYQSFMGISSHELFHAWNIKSIRPIEMYPYQYDKENYYSTGYVAEGVTTYYGDLCLYRSGYFTEEKYFDILAETITKYMDNEGRNNMSVAQASIDTWLDGYVKGVPNRKVSIYNEGSLLAYITDTYIRKSTANNKSLDDVMRELYNEFSQKNKGFSEDDYWKIISRLSNISYTNVFESLVWDTKSYLPHIEECLEYYGLKLSKVDNPKKHERVLGFKLSENTTVGQIHNNSPAYVSGLTFGDNILFINNIDVKGNANAFEKWIQCFEGEITLQVLRDDKFKTITIRDQHNSSFYPVYKISKKENINESEALNLQLLQKP